jgi:hypothetical protein
MGFLLTIQQATAMRPFASADSHHSLSSDRSSAAQLVPTVTSTYSSMSPLTSSSVLIDLVSVKDFLEDRLGRRVNVVTKEGLEPAIRERVLREAKAVFYWRKIRRSMSVAFSRRSTTSRRILRDMTSRSFARIGVRGSLSNEILRFCRRRAAVFRRNLRQMKRGVLA